MVARSSECRVLDDGANGLEENHGVDVVKDAANVLRVGSRRKVEEALALDAITLGAALLGS